MMVLISNAKVLMPCARAGREIWSRIFPGFHSCGSARPVFGEVPFECLARAGSPIQLLVSRGSSCKS